MARYDDRFVSPSNVAQSLGEAILPLECNLGVVMLRRGRSDRACVSRLQDLGSFLAGRAFRSINDLHCLFYSTAALAGTPQTAGR